jgi:2-dehydro-3-deoxyphosphooctonate aldolase (KDO 8-P synthase)
MKQSFAITPQVRIGDSAARPVLFAGPCVIERREHALKMARAIKAMAAEAGLPYVFKASYDKANRTSITSFRGPGLKAGVEILGEVKELAGVPILTDFHTPEQAEEAAKAADVLQIPAFLCRQTDMIVAAAKTGKTVNIKKGQFLSPWDVKEAVNKARAAGNEKVCVTERGFSFGYNNLVVDFRSFPVMREDLGVPAVFDLTHSLQLPGGAGNKSGGMVQYARHLARAGAAIGVDGFFMEVHDNPAEALSDGPNSIPLEELPQVLKAIAHLAKAAAEVQG